MAYYTSQVDTSPSNVLPAGKAGAALAVGDLVYRDSSGVWQKADAVAISSAQADRKDAEGVIWKAVQANEMVSPVKRLLLYNQSGLTIGAPVFLSSTAGASTQTDPGHQYVNQIVGRAITATEIEYDVQRSNDHEDGEIRGHTIQIGDSSTYADYSSANEKVIEVRADLNGASGDERVAYLRGKLGGASAQGEAVRAYMQVDGAVTQCHGIHATGEITTGGSVSGQIVGARCTAATGSGLTLSAGTINALRLDSDLNSAISSMTEAWIDIRDLNATNKFTYFVRMTDVSTTMFAAQSAAAVSHVLRCVINGTTYYFMMSDTA